MDQFFLTHKLYEENREPTIAGEDENTPRQLVTLLSQVNSNSYANGFFRFISPAVFRHYFSLWKLDPADCSPFIKSAFGQLIFYHQEQYKVLNPVFNSIDVLGEKDELEFVMNILLCDRPSLESSFLIDIYEQTSERLGVPIVDEIYAFIPALRLGGSRSASAVQKIKMNAEMMILSQL